MAVSLMPKPFKYFIVYNNGVDELELTTDPKGWQEHSIGFSRSEDFGNNVEVVVPLSFSGSGRILLKSLYEAAGVFAKASIRIEKRENDWSMVEFYVYRLNFKSYKDNLRFVEIDGIEDGLLSKFQTYKDTQYEIPLPTVNKEFLEYTGASVTKKNLIQCLYGSIQNYEKEGIGEDVYLLKGSRAVRTYNDSLVFTDPNGEPFQTMTFRCVKAVDFTAKVVLKLKVTANGTLFNPASGKIKIVKHNSSYASPTVIATYSPEYTYAGSSKRLDVFTTNTTQAFTLNVGDYVSIAYYAESPKPYDGISVDDAFDAYFEISNLTASAYIAQKIEVFSYEWLIEQLLTKIGGDATPTFLCDITYPDFTPMLSATPCIRNMGSLVGTGKIKTSLSDVLKSFNCLHKIGIDISGNTFTISSRNSFYLNESAGLITANNIVVSHDEKHQFSKITAGYSVDKQNEDSDLVFPFNCKKEFEIQDSQSENEIDLVNPFKGDCYDIDAYIADTLAQADNSDACELMVFATKLNQGVIEASFATYANDVQNSNSETLLIFWDVMPPVLVDPFIIVESNHAQGFGWGLPYLDYQFENTQAFYRVKIKVDVETDSRDGVIGAGFGLIAGFVDSAAYVYSDVETRGEYSYLREIDIILESYIGDGGDFTSPQIEFDLKDKTSVVFNEFSFSATLLSDGDVYANHKLYREHTITDFDVSAATVYNVPITPKRILQKHLDYISISNYGNQKDISFVNTDFISAITSKCDYEATTVTENAAVTDVTPMFLPALIECDTVQLLDSVTAFKARKYKYLQVQDEKTGKIYEGWINIITFAPTKDKSQKLIMQAKSI